MRVLLTDRFCERAKSTSVQTDYFDENVSGLTLRVNAKGVKAWTLHFTGPTGKRARITLGPLSLNLARQCPRTCP
jgi:hypothetical protein